MGVPSNTFARRSWVELFVCGKGGWDASAFNESASMLTEDAGNVGEERLSCGRSGACEV
jgi:hypothetical protein